MLSLFPCLNVSFSQCVVLRVKIYHHVFAFNIWLRHQTIAGVHRYLNPNAVWFPIGTSPGPVNSYLKADIPGEFPASWPPIVPPGMPSPVCTPCLADANRWARVVLVPTISSALGVVLPRQLELLDVHEEAGYVRQGPVWPTAFIVCYMQLAADMAFTTLIYFFSAIPGYAVDEPNLFGYH